MEVFITDAAILQRLEEIREYAEIHIFEMDELLDLMNEDKRVQNKEPRTDIKFPGERPEHCCYIPFDFKVVFTVDVAANGVKVRHVSIGRRKPDTLPSPMVLLQIIPYLGFKGGLGDISIKPVQGAIHAIQPVDYEIKG